MAQNTPFIFGAGGGQLPPMLNGHQQYSNSQPQSNDVEQQSQPAATQQTAFQQNAQLPSVDMSALAGISPEQLAAIARLFQAGALTLPPMPTEAPAETRAATQTVPRAVPRTSKAAQSHKEDIDMDKEEGELEEGEVGDVPKDREFLRPPPTGPRNRSASPRDPKLNKRDPSPRPPPPKQQPDKSKQPPQLQSKVNGSKKPTNGPVQTGKDAAAKSFVLQMVKSGYSFEDLAKEVDNPKPLARMFQQLGLSMFSDRPLNPNQLDGTASDLAVTDGAATSKAEESRKASVAKRAAPAKPVDRSEYLARLQAAKNKRPDTSSAQHRPANSAEEVIPVAEPEPMKIPINTGPKSATSRSVAASKREDKTELARQRLEAFRAQQAAKQNSTVQASSEASMTSPIPQFRASPTASQQAVSSPPPVGLGAGIADIAAKASQVASLQQFSLQPVVKPASAQAMISSQPPTHSRSFSGLPGLFMMGSSLQGLPATSTAKSPSENAAAPKMSQTQVSTLQSSTARLTASATASSRQLAASRKRPVAAEFEDALNKPKSTKRPFGQSRGASEDESVIIEISDDEDEDDEMEISENSKPQTQSFRDIGPLRDFPPRPNFSTQVSGPSTPGSNTPGGPSYEQRLKEIEAMKRKIAEAEKKKFANGKATGSKANDHLSATGTPKAAISTTSIAKPEAPPLPMVGNGAYAMPASALDGSVFTAPQANAVSPSNIPPSGKPVSAASLKRQHTKEQIRVRLLELEQDEFEDVAEAVEAAVEQPEPTESSAPTYTTAPERASEIIPVPRESNNLVRSPDDGELSESKEGELSDDSMSNLYDLEEKPNTINTKQATVDNEKVGSQATTASATSTSQFPPSHHETALTAGSLWPESLEDDVLVENGTDADSRTRSQLESQLPQPVARDVAMTGDGREPLNVEESLEDDRNDSDDEDQDLDDLDRPSASSIADQMYAQPDEVIDKNVSEEGEIDESESASATSSESETEELPTEAISPTTKEVGKDAAVAAISHGGATEPSVENDSTNGDDLATEIQPAEEQHAEEQHAELSEEKSAKHKSYYTPYESALKNFKDYKWHPNYLGNVSGGFKSLTYNHRIDPVKPLCRFEGAGGICNDPNCPDQHFRDMPLPENELLRILAMTNLPAHTSGDIKRWNEGLSAVVKQLRATDVGRDANAIATKISEYRRQFVADPTKVINLN